MPQASSAKAALLLICGDDDFGVKERARGVFRQWSEEIGGMDHEIIDAAVSHSGAALAAMGKLRAALQTLPFFGSGKVVWLQNCNFLGEERTANAQAVTETLGELGAELKEFSWKNVRLLISAGNVDKRRSFYKTVEKLGSVEILDGWFAEDKDWAEKAERFARDRLCELGREIGDEALARLVALTGPNPRALRSEIEKLDLYTAGRPGIETADVEVIVTRNKQARAFALGDALGERNLPRTLRCLDEELWEVRRDPQHSEIGLLYGLIGKVRVMLLAREMLARKWVRPEKDFRRFKDQLGRVPAEEMPEDKKLNPLAVNPYVMFKAASQSANYTQAELISAMEILLECNGQLISRSLDSALVLQQALVRIVGRPGGQDMSAAA